MGGVPERSDLIFRVGRRIAELRRDAGMTQRDMALLLDMSVRNYRRIELGERNLTLRAIEEIATLLRALPHELLIPPRPESMLPIRGRPRKR